MYFDTNECRAPTWRPHTLQACNLTTTSLGQPPPQVPTDLLQPARIDDGVCCPCPFLYVLLLWCSVEYVFYKCVLKIASGPPHCAVWLLCMFNIFICRWGMIVWSSVFVARRRWLDGCLVTWIMHFIRCLHVGSFIPFLCFLFFQG
jgi:hypothetical protein